MIWFVLLLLCKFPNVFSFKTTLVIEPRSFEPIWHDRWYSPSRTTEDVHTVHFDEDNKKFVLIKMTDNIYRFEDLGADDPQSVGSYSVLAKLVPRRGCIGSKWKWVDVSKNGGEEDNKAVLTLAVAAPNGGLLKFARARRGWNVGNRRYNVGLFETEDDFKKRQPFKGIRIRLKNITDSRDLPADDVQCRITQKDKERKTLTQVFSPSDIFVNEKMQLVLAAGFSEKGEFRLRPYKVAEEDREASNGRLKCTGPIQELVISFPSKIEGKSIEIDPLFDFVPISVSVHCKVVGQTGKKHSTFIFKELQTKGGQHHFIYGNVPFLDFESSQEQ